MDLLSLSQASGSALLSASRSRARSSANSGAFRPTIFFPPSQSSFCFWPSGSWPVGFPPGAPLASARSPPSTTNNQELRFYFIFSRNFLTCSSSRYIGRQTTGRQSVYPSECLHPELHQLEGRNLMRLLNLVELMSYIVMQRIAVVSVAILASAILAIPASADTDTSAARDACVSTAMVGLLRREGNAVRVSRRTELVPEKPGARENEKGVALAQAQDVLRTLREAHNWFEKGARKGYAPAQVNLAVSTLAGWGTPPSAGTALYWLREAARQGYALAYFDLGVLYMNGCGVHRDYHEAFSQFEQGANAGDSAAQTNLGYLYDQGLGVAEDRAQAAVWYRKAAESGVAQAQYNLADLYVRGEGVPRDESTAFAWFQKAAQQGHTGARIMLASMYAEGCGIEKNPQAAYEWISAAMLQGDTRGATTLQALEQQLTPDQLAKSKMRAQVLAQVPRRRSDAEVALLH